MAALSLHHAIFTNGKDSDLPLRSANFLHPVPERDGSPTSQLSASAAYQDLIERQPTHPDGPTSGWDLGLNLLGDPITASEHKGLEDHLTKMKLRRLRAINFAFELLFGIWGTYTTVRYFLAFDDGLSDTRGVCALVLGIISALAVALVITSVLMPLFPRQSYPYVWRYKRMLLRACYLLLLSASTVVNFVLVLIWHPSELCSWDIDISWYASAVNTITSPCHTAPFGAWIAAATLRLVVTSALSLSFVYTLRSYHETRHPNSDENNPKYSSYLPSDPEDVSPVFISSPRRLSKSTFRLTRSKNSSGTLLNQSNSTLPKSNSISTLAPSTSCTGQSRSHSTPPPKDVSPPRISPSTSRRPSNHAANQGPFPTPFGSETSSQTQPVNAVTQPLSASHILRRTSRVAVDRATLDTMSSNDRLQCEGSNSPTVAGDSSEIRSWLSRKLGHRGSGAHSDVRKPTSRWENAHVGHAAQAGASPKSSSSVHADGESIREKDRRDDVLVYSYGYGASEPTYPYLDTYNPPRPGRYAESSTAREDANERGLLQGYRRAIPGGPGLPGAPSEPRSSPSVEDEEEEESGGEEEEYVAMMGGFVRRMATIESLGSKEAAGTLSTTTTGSVALHSMRSKTPVSQFSSVRFAERGSTGASASGVMPLSVDGSLSTAYLSFSSGGTGMRVNERGELLPVPNVLNRSAASSPCDRQYFTASGSSFPRMDDESR